MATSGISNPAKSGGSGDEKQAEDATLLGYGLNLPLVLETVETATDLYGEELEIGWGGVGRIIRKSGTRQF